MSLQSRLMLAALAAAVTSPALAYDLPTLNLGATSFMDGAPPAGEGWYLTEYLQYYTANHLNDSHGDGLPLPKQSIDVVALLNQVTYVSDKKLGNANLGVQFLLPTVLSAETEDGLGGAALEGKTGVGDLQIGPFLQFAPIMGAQGPKMLNRLEFTFILPTGEYDKTAAVQPGANYWSFNPYWSSTYFFTDKITASWRLHYLWNAKNHDPASGFGNDVSTTQAGQAVHANWTLDYALTPQLRVGLNGYWLNQFTDTEADGHKVSGRKESVWAIGPGALYSFSKDDHLFLNAYVEQDAENRSEGTRLQARWVHHF
jgi:hypothetical protein